MIVVVIPAKGQSTRLPNKNMTLLNGRPMVDFTIDFALASELAQSVYVSTDSDEIAAHAESRGISVIRRPESLGGEVPILDVYRHALDNMDDGDKVEILIGLQPDHPDRDVAIDETIRTLQENGADRVMSHGADGTHNGAHYVLSRHFLDTAESRKDVTITDDCTNIHFPEDLERAEERLKGRS
jgi:CMP-N-acetylneuraminic acid synthetase